MNQILMLILTLTAFLFSVTFHEFCHALVAYWLGDDTGKRLGRLTLNPLAHIDPLGLLFLILIRIGWAKPVPFNPENFKYPRFYSVLVGLAGPLSNFILAMLFIIILVHGLPLITTIHQAAFTEILKSAIYINVMLGVFNLFPIPPLDGSHIIAVFIPDRWKYYYAVFAQYSIFLLLILFTMPAFRHFFLRLIQSTTKMLFSLVI